ncbi:hypothetical protein BU16DRAFT_244437 [Lophium mytilinum]|uniref:MIF4G domain-containing protein n=1 Tax=Lophium mytilinum TaxID=390894 RepID=A0A6A6R7J3_9PEZI|nr:hypothetical protein BU16DRAFT_244437 [Lophium mytilinum]
MSTSISTAPNPTAIAAQSANAASSPATASTPTVAAGSAQPTARSYANATKKPVSSPAIASSTAPPVAVGGPAPQHGKSSSISPVNGKGPITPAVPVVGPPTIVNSSAIVNGAPVSGDHARKPSVTISAAGTTGFTPNGGPVPPNSRAPSNITFGSIAPGGSPAISHSSPHSQAGNLATPRSDPRITSPAQSPSPIPPPASSGGRPPSGLQPGQQGLVFGGVGNEGGENNMRPVSMPPNANPLPQAQHLRRESSQSAHSDMSNSNMNNMNRGYAPNGGRGRGYNTGYAPIAHSSPGPQYRPLPNQQRVAPNMPPQFQGQGQMGNPANSPYRQNRSPAITPAAMHQQAHIANPQQMPYPNYHPQHFPHQPVGSHSHSPHQQAGPPSSNFIGADSSHIFSLSLTSTKPPFRPAPESSLSRPPQIPDISKASGYDQFLTAFAHQGMYGMQQTGLDPNYGYYPQQYPMHQQMPYSNAAPPSPRPGYPQVAQGFVQGAYGNPPHAQGMSRTSSQVSERPASTIAAPQTPSLSNANHVSHTHTPSVGTASPAPSSNFTIPKPKSKAIVIKNADGEVLDFAKQKAASPAPPTAPRSPAIASTPTPPPRAPSANESAHSRTESVANKTAEERKAEFVKQFQEQIHKDNEEKVKTEADAKAKEEKDTKDRAEAEAKSAKEKEEADAKAAKVKEDEEKAKAEAEAAEKAKKEADEAERLKKEEDERIEREIAEMEELERQEEERERAFQEKRKKEKEEQARKEAEKAANAEEEMRKAEREAEALEEAREKARQTTVEETPEEKAEREALFASLKKSPFAPPATESPATPTAEAVMPPPTQPKSAPTSGKPKPVPHPLKIETNKAVEPAQPTAGMQALKSARFLQVRNEALNYPEGIKSPNPALNQGGKSKGRQYDKDFLLQFQEVFREKPSTDWELKLKETVGDSSDSARPQSARTPMGGMGGRGSSRPSLPTGLSGGTMGMFSSVGGRTLRPGTTSEERFQAATQGGAPPRAQTMSNPLAQFANRPGGFPMGGPPQMARTGSFQNMSQNGPNSPRNASSRGRGSKRGTGNKRDEEIQAKQMPLTAGLDLKPLEKSQTGWKPTSIGAPPATQIMSAGHMAPDLVQRKVKAALNKMTPEKFDRIADQILEIAAQSKEEADGRTLRQVIQLTFEKACDEAHWASMYAKFCKRMLETMSTDIKDENVRDKAGNPVVGGALFRKYLLNRCQEEFERGWEVNLPQKPEGESQEAVLLSDEYYIAAGAKRKGLGLIQFIGELYKLGMLTLRIMHECVLKLLDFEGTPDESAIESLVKLLRTVGFTMENTETGPKMIQLYFERIQKIMSTEGLPSRLHFMLLDTVDLRKKGWRSKDDQKGPKTIQEIHQEALAAQQAAEMERSRSNRGGGGNRQPMGRGDARSFSGNNMMPPPDYNRNQLGMDDLRKLTKNASGRNLSNSPAQLGPSSLFGSRSSSGRKGLGPSLMNRTDDSGASSRTGTPPVQKEKESTTHVNSFSALAALDASGEGAGEVASPPSTTSSPPVSKSQPRAEDKKDDDAKPSE